MRELKQNWLDIFSAFRIAIDPKKMMLGFVGAVVSLAIIFGLLFAFERSFPKGPGVVAGFLLDPLNRTEIEPLTQALGNHLMPGMLGAKELGLIVLTGILMLLVWSYFGGAIMRSAAVEFAKDDRMDLRESTSFARKKFTSFFWAPVVPWLGILFFLLCIYVGGLLGRWIPWVGPVAAGIFFFLALLAGFLIVLIALGAAFGKPLMWPTVAVEGTDAFDAISRSFSYVFGRPWRYIWYYLVGLAYGAVCVAFVAGFAFVLIRIVLCAGRYGMGEVFRPIEYFIVNNARQPGADFVQNFCAVLMKAGIFAVWGLAVGFAISMMLTLNTVVYCLLRKDVDGTDMTEVYIEEEEEEERELAAVEEQKAAEAEGTPPAEQKEGAAGQGPEA